MQELISQSSYPQILKLELSANKKDIQKPDSASTVLTHIIHSIRQLPEHEWKDTVNAVSASYSCSHPSIRCLVESPSKVKLLVDLFGYRYFEESASILSPSFFKKLYRVSSSVSFTKFKRKKKPLNIVSTAYNPTSSDPGPGA
jgi:hypothetical protein